MRNKLFIIVLLIGLISYGQTKKIDQMVESMEQYVIELRRHFHQYPELSNREFKTAEKIAEQLKRLGIEVQTGVAHTGVVGVLKGDKPGPVVALRADMDALAVTEKTDVSFASKAKGNRNGKEVDVMHACGHDAHMAILLGAAEVLSNFKKNLKGTVKFIFQPAEEGAPSGEEGGASLMIKEGVLKNPAPEVIFGLHINSTMEVGKIQYKPKGIMAACQNLDITLKGTQSHGGKPWEGNDPIVVAAQIINALQTIVSRKSELTKEATVISVGSIHAGDRANIIPEKVTMKGSVRTLDYGMQTMVNKEIKKRVKGIAEAYGVEAQVSVKGGYPITYNDPDLTAKMLPSLKKSAGKDHVNLIDPVTWCEDFSYYQKEIPGMFFFLGARPKDVKKEDAPSHHTPHFYLDESGFKIGVKAFVNLVLDYTKTKIK